MKKYTFLDLGIINKPYFEEIKRATARVIESGRYIGGDEVVNFEHELASICNAPYAIGVSTGLDAIRIIIRGYLELGVFSKGDEIIVPANTFIASVLAITENGLNPVFVEPNLLTHNLDSNLIEHAITPRTRAIMPVHLYGRVCWDKQLVDIANKYDLKIIEDNAQAIGAIASCDGLHGSRKTGALGDAGAFSFYPTKNIGALGDAGAIITHDKKLAETAIALRNYGSDRQYHNIYTGLNCRLDPIQAAILSLKLKYLGIENEHRQSIADTYENNISNKEIIKPLNDSPEQTVWHQYVVRVKERDNFRKYLANNGVETAIHYATPPHLQPCYKQYARLNLPISEKLCNEVVSLPITRCTSISDAQEIASIINQYNRNVIQ